MILTEAPDHTIHSRLQFSRHFPVSGSSAIRLRPTSRTPCPTSGVGIVGIQQLGASRTCIQRFALIRESRAKRFRASAMLRRHGSVTIPRRLPRPPVFGLAASSKPGRPIHGYKQVNESARNGGS